MKRLAILPLALCLCAFQCQRPQPGFPPVDDVKAVVEPKPQPTEDILTDPAANDRFNSAIEGWGDRVFAAGGRLCRYFRDMGMKVSCPE